MSSPLQDGADARRVVRVVNASGLHARPCHAIVSLAQQYSCELRVACGGREVNGRSILELMTLGASTGAEITFTARGTGATELVDRLEQMVAAGFDEVG